MRLTTVFLIAFLLQLSAATLAQKVSINLKNASLKTAIREIKSQTGYDFVYQESVFESARPVTIKINKQDVLVVLKEIFENQPLTYELRSNTVIVKAAEKSFLDNLIARFQAIDVRGRVVDEKGVGMPGATVKVKRTGKTVLTDNVGGFYLKNLEEGDLLVISFIGYAEKEVHTKADMGHIELKLSDSKLDAGYGESKSRLARRC